MELSYNSIVTENGKLPKQNRLWWLYVSILSKETGNDKNEMHELLKSKFMPFATSTTELTQKQFADIVNEIIKWSAEYLNVILPYEDTENPEA